MYIYFLYIYKYIVNKYFLISYNLLNPDCHTTYAYNSHELVTLDLRFIPIVCLSRARLSHHRNRLPCAGQAQPSLMPYLRISSGQARPCSTHLKFKAPLISLGMMSTPRSHIDWRGHITPRTNTPR